MSAEVARILREAADLIEPPGQWTKECSARDVRGNAVSPKDSNAACWCAVGAIARQASDDEVERTALEFVRPLISYRLVGNWNDQQPSPVPVVAVLREAADEAEES